MPCSGNGGSLTPRSDCNRCACRSATVRASQGASERRGHIRLTSAIGFVGIAASVSLLPLREELLCFLDRVLWGVRVLGAEIGRGLWQPFRVRVARQGEQVLIAHPE